MEKQLGGFLSRQQPDFDLRAADLKPWVELLAVDRVGLLLETEMLFNVKSWHFLGMFQTFLQQVCHQNMCLLYFNAVLQLVLIFKGWNKFYEELKMYTSFFIQSFCMNNKKSWPTYHCSISGLRICFFFYYIQSHALAGKLLIDLHLDLDLGD